jgi:cold shock CspA family protein
MARGTVSSFDRSKLMGFIDTDRGESIFFHREDVVPDAVGRTYLLAGCEVEFEWGIDERGRPKAINVRDISPQTKMIDQKTYEEVGLLTVWNRDGERAHGYALRPNGEALFVPAENCREALCPGTRIRYRIGFRIRSSDRKLLWFARQVEIVEPESLDVPEPIFAQGSIEDFFLRSSGELPVETAAAPDTPEVERVYSEAERKLTLKQLIARKLVA